MSFDQNKANLLQQLQKQKQDQIMRQRGLEAQNRLREKERAATGSISLASVKEIEKTNKPPLVLFGLKSLFITTLKNLLQQYCEIFEYDNIDSASNFLFSNKVPIAVMDIDPPNDSKACQDFFSTGKTINPDMQYIVYQKDELQKLPEAAVILQKQGAFVFRKPIDRIELVELIKRFTAEWRIKNAD